MLPINYAKLPKPIRRGEVITGYQSKPGTYLECIFIVPDDKEFIVDEKNTWFIKCKFINESYYWRFVVLYYSWIFG